MTIDQQGEGDRAGRIGQRAARSRGAGGPRRCSVARRRRSRGAPALTPGTLRAVADDERASSCRPARAATMASTTMPSSRPAPPRRRRRPAPRPASGRRAPTATAGLAAEPVTSTTTPMPSDGPRPTVALVERPARRLDRRQPAQGVDRHLRSAQVDARGDQPGADAGRRGAERHAGGGRDGPLERVGVVLGGATCRARRCSGARPPARSRAPRGPPSGPTPSS